MPASPARADAVEIGLKDGRTVVGELLEFTDDRIYVLAVAGKTLRVPEDQVRRIAAAGSADAAEDVPGPAAAPATPVPEELDALDWSDAGAAGKAEAQAAYEEGLAARREGKIEAARDAFQRARELDPWFPPARFQAAWSLVKLEEYEAALPVLSDLLAIEPKCLPALRLRIVLHRMARQREPYLAACEAYLAVVYAEPELSYRRAHFWLAEGDTEKARAEWGNYRRADPEQKGPFNLEGQLQREGEIFAAKGDPLAAIDRFFGAVRANPLLRGEMEQRVEEVQRSRIADSLKEGDYTGAMLILRILGETYPARAAAFHGEARTLAAAGMQVFIADRKADRVASLWMALQEMLTLEERVEILASGVRQVAEALAADPEAEGWRGVLTVLKDRIPAEAAAEATAPVRTGLADLYQALAGRFAEKAEFVQAFAAIDAAIALDPARGDGVRPQRLQWAKTAAQFHARNREWDLAARAFDRVAELDPADEAARQSAAESRYESVRQGITDETEISEKIARWEKFLTEAAPGAIRENGESELARLRLQWREMLAHSTQERNKYYPLAEGSWFKYVRNDGESEEISVGRVDYTERDATITLNQSSGAGAVAGRSWVLRHTPEGLAYADEENPEILFKLPIEKNREWKWTRGVTEFTRKYVSLDETVQTTRLGTFKNCLKVEFKSTLPVAGAESFTVVSDWYYAPGVGLVKMVNRDEKMAGSNFELEAYRLGPAQ